VSTENGANSENIENSAPTSTTLGEPFEIGTCLSVSCTSLSTL